VTVRFGKAKTSIFPGGQCPSPSGSLLRLFPARSSTRRATNRRSPPTICHGNRPAPRRTVRQQGRSTGTRPSPPNDRRPSVSSAYVRRRRLDTHVGRRTARSFDCASWRKTWASHAWRGVTGPALTIVFETTPVIRWWSPRNPVAWVMRSPRTCGGPHLDEGLRSRCCPACWVGTSRPSHEFS
jgi:hypothetical protein